MVYATGRKLNDQMLIVKRILSHDHWVAMTEKDVCWITQEFIICIVLCLLFCFASAIKNMCYF